VVAADAALHLALDPEFRLTGRAGGQDVDATGAGDPREASVSRFLAAAGSGDASGVPCTPADALLTLEVALACEQAIATGNRIDL
jgi:predicted dehydrogenase